MTLFPLTTLRDKLFHLLSIRNTIVLVQFHELERLKLSNRLSNHRDYIEYLYDHYVLLKKSKTYLN